MQMFACAATCGTSDANGEAGENGLAFGDEDSGEVAVADAEVTVAERDEVAGTGVVACLFYCAAEYGIDDGGMGCEVNAVVHTILVLPSSLAALPIFSNHGGRLGDAAAPPAFVVFVLVFAPSGAGTSAATNRFGIVGGFLHITEGKEHGTVDDVGALLCQLCETGFVEDGLLVM